MAKNDLEAGITATSAISSWHAILCGCSQANYGVEDVSEGLLRLKILVELEWGLWPRLEAAAVLLVCAEGRGRGALGHRPCAR